MTDSELEERLKEIEIGELRVQKHWQEYRKIREARRLRARIILALIGLGLIAFIAGLIKITLMVFG